MKIIKLDLWTGHGVVYSDVKSAVPEGMTQRMFLSHLKEYGLFYNEGCLYCHSVTIEKSTRGGKR